MTAQRNTAKKFLSTSALTIGLFALGAQAAMAMDDFTTPTGEQVVGGSASFDRPGAGTLNVNQSTDRVVINWDSFNIGEKAKTEFFQPGSGSLAVNRVTGKGSDPTQILGTLKANGRVMVLDRNGVLFGANSRTDVGGIVASTGDVDNNAVMRGDTTLELSNFGDKSVINNGTISVSGAGLAALVAPHAANNGVIEAKLGKVALASGGERATVDLYGDGLVEIAVGGAKGKALAENNGTIEGATVLMTASGAKEVVDTVINMNGVIKAGSVTQKGGKIILNGGSAGKVKVSGTIDASGANGGGDIDVRGNDIELTGTSLLSADAGTTGNGGKIIVFGDTYALMSGRASARGGRLGGNGGFMELSAKETVGFDGEIDLGTDYGTIGTFLIDPRFIIIHSGSDDAPNQGNTPLADKYVLSAASLAAALKNAAVILQATDFIDIGTRNTYTGVLLNGETLPAGLGTGDIDVSATLKKKNQLPPQAGGCSNSNPGSNPNCSGHYEITAGALTLQSALVNFNKNLIMGTGNLSVLANTANLGAQIQSRGNIGDTATLMDTSRISGNASLVNVKSNAARIDQGIALARNGGTVDVFAGNYAQDGIIINKALTLLGAGNSQTVLTDSPLVITAGGVTVDGFTMTKATSTPNSWSGSAVWIQGAGGTNATGTRGNYVIGDNGTGRGGNTITGNHYAGIYLSGGNLSGVSIIGNTITGAYDGIENNFSTNDGRFSELKIQKNTISGGPRGMGLHFLAGNNEVTNNFISASNGALSSSGSANNATLRVYNNSFDGSTGQLVENSNSFTVNASNNWWGTTSETVIAARMSGSVDFSPYLLSGTDVSSAPGFRGNFSNVFVTALGAQTGATGRVQEGVNVTLANGTLRVGAGTFNGAVAVNKTLTLLGANAGIAGNGVRGAESIIAPNSPGFNVTADNVTIDGFTVTGASGADGYGIWINNADNANVKNNAITGSAQSGIQFTGASGGSATNNLITGSGDSGVRLDVSHGVTVSNNRISGSAIDGVRAFDSSFLTANNNVIQANGSGIGLWNSDDGSFTGNTVTASVGFWIGNGSDRANILTNTTNSTGAGVLVWSAGGAGSHDAVIKGNTINGGFNGILILNSDNAVIGTSVPGEGNTVTGTAATAIGTMYANGTSIAGNSITNAGDDGIGITAGRDVTITENAISGAAKNGIHLIGTAGTNLIDDNTVNNVNGSGIRAVSLSGLTISNNKIGTLGGINNVAGQGIYILSSHGTDATHQTLITGNTLNNIAGNGIFSDSSNFVRIGGTLAADKNTVTAKLDGVKLEGGNFTVVQGNTISNAGRVGIYSNNATNLLVDNNTLNGTTFDIGSPYGAITTEKGSNATITGNTITNSTQGVRMMWVDGVNTISGNTINTLAHNGVHVEDTDGLNVTGNFIGQLGGASNIKGNGIHVSLSNGANISGNAVEHVSKRGINVSKGSSVTIDSNILNRIGQEGIRTDQVQTLSITGNDLDNIGWNGVDVQGGSNVTLHKNVLKKAGGRGLNVAGSQTAVTVTKNTVSNTGESGIVVNGVQNAKINGNTINTIGTKNNADYSGIAATGVTLGLVAANNQIGTLGANGNIKHTGITVKNTNGAVIRDNTIANAKNGIAADNTDGLMIKGNTLSGRSNGTGTGIAVSDSDDVQIKAMNLVAGYRTGIGSDTVTNLLVTHNLVLGSTANGIHAKNSNGAKIIENAVGLGLGNGVTVENSDNAKIRRNLIGLLGGNGVVVAGSEDSVVAENIIMMVGGNGVTLRPANGSYSDGSIVTNNLIRYVGGDGISAFDTYDLEITDNTIRNVGGDGVFVNEGSNTLIQNNTIRNFRGNGVAIDEDYGTARIIGNTIRNGNGAGSDGINVNEGDVVVIRDNSIDRLSGDGIEVANSRRVRIVRNEIGENFFVAGNGILLDGNNKVRLLSNVISNSGAAGLYAAGSNNGTIVLEDNTFNNNPVGAWFESGLVDLTGATNAFNDGDVALRFAPVPRGGGSLNLVGNTIGTTEFNGQSRYYVELRNGALFTPGSPTVIDGLNASYDGFVPSSVGGILTLAQYNALESMFYHYNDDASLGLFFFGAVPGINDEDIYNTYSNAGWSNGRFRMTIAGLPRLPGSGNGGNNGGGNGQGGFLGNVADFLANLAPAAGGDDNGQKKGKSFTVAGQLADLEPASGDQEDPSCWSQAVAQAQSGATVDYSFGGSAEETLNQAAACGGAI